MEFQFLTFLILAYFAISLTIRPKYLIVSDNYSGISQPRRMLFTSKKISDAGKLLVFCNGGIGWDIFGEC